jgi:c-di-GMP-binding flagellar brake protein YcgR
MFEVGKVYKVKVETVPGQPGFGRATILERKGNQLTIHVRTSKEPNAALEKGTRVWFVSDPTQTFNGLWASSVVACETVEGKPILRCSPPKLEPLYQRRRTPRVVLDVPVQLTGNGHEYTDIRSKDISRSGIALETDNPLEGFPESGEQVNMIVQSAVGAIPAEARIIRTEHNWLANKTVIGLEFTDLTDEAVEILDQLLVLHGGKPRNPDTAEIMQQTNAAAGKKGLASWINAPSEVRGRFVGTTSDDEQSDKKDVEESKQDE